MVKVDEVHGIYQCLPEDILNDGVTNLSVNDNQPQEYVPLTAEPNWFFDQQLLDAEAKGLHNPKYSNPLDFAISKFQLDSLYLQKKYKEGLALAHASYKFHGEETDVKRELVDLMAQFAMKCKDMPMLDECLRWLDQYCKVNDTGILWLRICIARLKGQPAGIRAACEEYLNLRSGEQEVIDILNSVK